MAGMRSRLGFSTCKSVAYPVRDLLGSLLEEYLYNPSLVNSSSLSFESFR
jgi:hypothetical protein